MPKLYANKGMHAPWTIYDITIVESFLHSLARAGGIRSLPMLPLTPQARNLLLWQRGIHVDLTTCVGGAVLGVR
jgi:hypothetical protein